MTTKPHIKGYGHLYGYQGWLGRTILNGRDLQWTTGFGYGGQRLFVQLDFDLVVAVAAGDYASPLRLQGLIPLDIFAQHVLPAVAGD